MARALLHDLIDDALNTTERIAADARHLRELGGRAAMGAKLAAARAKVKIETALERAADSYLEIEERIGAAAATARRGRRP